MPDSNLEAGELWTGNPDPWLTTFIRYLNFIRANYRTTKKLFGESMSYNQSLQLLKRQVRHKSDEELVDERGLDYGVRLVLGHNAKALMGCSWTPGRGSNVAAARATLRSLGPQRGRPQNTHLAWHVQAIMLLLEEITGREVRSSQTKNSVYDPNLSGLGQVIEAIFKDLDPSVSKTALANVVRTTRTNRTLEGRRFLEFCPADLTVITPL